MPSEAVNEATRREWRDLGFFYELKDNEKEWRLVGSRSGLLKFRDLLMRYAANSRNEAKSEHDHYGPYLYLKVMTWSEPGMDGNAIYGALQDLRQLAGIFEAKLHDARAGSVLRIQKEYADGCKYCLVLDVREDGFDPASDGEKLLVDVVKVGHRKELATEKTFTDREPTPPLDPIPGQRHDVR